jgi:hypothetical protein
MTATTSTSIRTASGWTLALWTTIALVLGVGVGSAATAVLTDDGSAPASDGPRATVDASADRTPAVLDRGSPDALEHRLAAGGGAAVNSLPAAAGVFTADAAEEWLGAAGDHRLDLCTGAVVAADAVEHCLGQP